MKLSKGTLVAVVDGEKLALFENTGQQDIALTARPPPAIEERASGAAGRIGSPRLRRIGLDRAEDTRL